MTGEHDSSLHDHHDPTSSRITNKIAQPSRLSPVGQCKNNFEYLVIQHKEEVEASILHLESSVNKKRICLPHPTTSIVTTDAIEDSLKYFLHYSYDVDHDVRTLEDKHFNRAASTENSIKYSRSTVTPEESTTLSKSSSVTTSTVLSTITPLLFFETLLMCYNDLNNDEIASNNSCINSTLIPPMCVSSATLKTFYADSNDDDINFGNEHPPLNVGNMEGEPQIVSKIENVTNGGVKTSRNTNLDPKESKPTYAEIISRGARDEPG